MVGPADFLIGRLADDESGGTEGGEGPMETETAAGADTFLSLTGEEGELTSRVLTFLSLLILVTDVVIVDIDEESACLDLLHSMFDGGCDVGDDLFLLMLTFSGGEDSCLRLRLVLLGELAERLASFGKS